MLAYFSDTDNFMQLVSGDNSIEVMADKSTSYKGLDEEYLQCNEKLREALRQKKETILNMALKTKYGLHA